MKKGLIISLFFFSLNGNAQDYVARWTPTSQSIDSVQQGADSIYFKTIATVPGGLDSCIIPGPPYYYRIKSGNLKSNIVALFDVLSIAPDPIHQAAPKPKKLGIKIINSSSLIYIKIESVRYEEITCTLSDITGRRLLQKKFNLYSGANEIEIPAPLLNGIYIINFQSYFENETRKIVK